MTTYLRNVTINTIWEATEAIYNILISEGWEWITGSPNDLPMVLAGKEVNSVRPYLRFSKPEGSQIRLRMNGDAFGNGSILSANWSWDIEPDSKLWMAANNEACCIYLRGIWDGGYAYHAGALERVDPNDGWAWAIGMLTTSPFAGTYQTARGLNQTSYWQNNTAYQGIYANIFTGRNYDSRTINTTLLGTPILAPYFRFYGNEFRGIVKFAVSGLAGAIPGTEYEQRDPETGNVTKIYISSGVGAFEVYSA